MKPDVQKKVASCKALKEMTVAELVATVRFRDNLAAYWTAQKEDRKAIRASYDAMRKLGGAKGYKLPAHPIDDLMDLSLVDLATEYTLILSGASKRPFAERQYIKQLGQQAYNLTVAQYVVDEYPELADELIPKSKN